MPCAINSYVSISRHTMIVPNEHEQTWDAVEEYFECIVECSLEDKECVEKCLVTLKEEA